MKMQLSYKNEEDKSYGVTGMAMSVVIFDGEDMFVGANLDSESGSMMEFTNDFYFSGNPGYSAKTAWNMLLKNFNLATAVVLGNVLCRRLIYEARPVDDELTRSLHEIVVDAAGEHCSLEEDEADRLFEKNYNYLRRVFSHSGMQGVAHEFAETLRKRRYMSRMDVIDRLRSLGML